MSRKHLEAEAVGNDLLTLEESKNEQPSCLPLDFVFCDGDASNSCAQLDTRLETKPIPRRQQCQENF